MVMSQDFFSRLFLSHVLLFRAVVIVSVISSHALSAMNWDGEFTSHNQMAAAEENPVLTLKDDGSAPEGYVLVDQLLTRKRDLREEKMRITKLAIKAIENVPGMEQMTLVFKLDLAADAGAQLADCFSGFAQAHNGLIDLLGGSVKIKVLKLEIAAPILEELDKVQQGMSAGLLQSTVSMAKELGRFDVIAELEKREMTQEEKSAMRWGRAKKMFQIAAPVGVVMIAGIIYFGGRR